MQNSQNYMLGYYIDNGFKYFVYNKQNSNIRVGQWLKIGSLSELIFSDFILLLIINFILFSMQLYYHLIGS